MKNETILAALLLCCTFSLTAQTSIQKKISNTSGKKILMDFNRANAKIIAWDKNEVSIKGSVSINNGDHDENFTIDIEEKSNEINITTFVKGIKNLPKMIVIKGEEEKHYFKDNTEGRKALKEFKRKSNGKYNSWSEGVHVEINLEIHVPKNSNLSIESLYGHVDLENITSQVNVENTYGHVDVKMGNTFTKTMTLHSTYNFVDVSLPASAKLDVKLNTGYGEIYTDLNIQQEDSSQHRRNFGSKVSGVLNGGGTPLHVEATYNNIYLRQGDN